MKKIAVLGSTGSIGRQTLEVIKAFPDRFAVFGLASGMRAEALAEQVLEHRPAFVSSADPAQFAALGLDLSRLGCQFSPPEEMAAHPEVDLVVVATAGRAGLGPTMAALRAGKTVALANKEVLVLAGEIVRGVARTSGARILPIDSEHSALWQCLLGEAPGHKPTGWGDDLVGLGLLAGGIRRLILTASGGPFRDLSPQELAKVTPPQALQHPNWVMGPKVTIDSATLMNKGLEVIEARWLFGVPFNSIEIILHRESIVHSLVEFIDGSVKAQLGLPDMRLPIQYALAHPARLGNARPRLDLASLGQLTFGPLDWDKYPCLSLAMEAGRRGQTYPAALSGADEAAVELFLAGRIGFLDIPKLVARVLEQHAPAPNPTLEEVLAADGWARATCRQLATTTGVTP